jgi:hypothetical protein
MAAATASGREHLAAVGFVTSQWATLEMRIDQFTLELGRIPFQAGSCLTAQIFGPARKLDAYIAIARLRGADSFLPELERFSKDATSIAEQRNRVVHDPWITFQIGTASCIEITARRKFRHLLIEVSTTEIVDLYQKIIALTERFSELHNRIKAIVNT